MIAIPRLIRRPHGADRGDDHPVVVWSEMLIWFFRIMSVVQMLKGLVHWALLLTAASTTGQPMTPDMVAFRAATIYFAVLDPVAGVGLWLTSSWGAVLWLLAAASQVSVCIAFPEVFGPLWLLVAFELATIGTYVFLTIKLAQTNEAAS